MKSPEVQFTPEDRLILDSYCQMLDGLAQYLGTGYELVLHRPGTFGNSGDE